MKHLTITLLTLLLATSVYSAEDKNYIFNTPPMFAGSTSGMGALCAGADNKNSDRFSPENDFEYIKIHNEINKKYSDTLATPQEGFLYVSTYDEPSEKWLKIDAYISGVGLSFFRDSFNSDKGETERCILALGESLNFLLKSCSSDFDKTSEVDISSTESIFKNAGDIEGTKTLACRPITQLSLDMHGLFLTKEHRHKWDEMVEKTKKETGIDLNEQSYPKFE